MIINADEVLVDLKQLNQMDLLSLGDGSNNSIEKLLKCI